MKNILLTIAIIFFTLTVSSQSSNISFGVTLCGAEFGQNNLPGILNTNYTYPVTEEINYFSEKGAQIIQLPIRWERVQRKLGGPLDAMEMSHIMKFVDECAARGVMVTLIMQNYGRYKINNIEYIIGSPEVTRADYKDVWMKLAYALRNKRNIFALSIMSEPNNMGQYSWFESAQQAIDGIRQVDAVHTILVDGDNFSGPETWVAYNDQLKYLRDPSDKIMFNAHCYFDEDRTGSYRRSYDASGANPMTGVNRISPFINWLHANNVKGFVGEFGVPNNDPRWLVTMENFLNYLMRNRIGGCYWAAGRWWKDYALSIEPSGNSEKPQMNVFAKYLIASNNSSVVARN